MEKEMEKEKETEKEKEKETEKETKAEKKYLILRNFCVVLLILFGILVGYWVFSYIGLHNSQKEIVQMHANHVASVDSLFCDIKKNLLQENEKAQATVSLLLDSIAQKYPQRNWYINRALVASLENLVKTNNAKLLASEFKKDSILCKHEALIAQEQIKQMLSLHIDKIDNDYSIVGIWGAVLSIIFLTFGFFAIFKIEESRAEVNKILSDARQEGENITEDIKSKSSHLQHILNDLREQSESFQINSNQQLQDFSERTNNILVDLEKVKQEMINSKIQFEQRNEELTSQQIERMKQWESEFKDLKKKLKKIIDDNQQKDEEENSHE